MSELRPEHLKIELWPPHTMGGQHTNGPDHRGVKVTHLPTGLEAYCASERGQHKNRTVAMSMIEWGLAALNPNTEASC